MINQFIFSLPLSKHAVYVCMPCLLFALNVGESLMSCKVKAEDINLEAAMLNVNSCSLTGAITHQPLTTMPGQLLAVFANMLSLSQQVLPVGFVSQRIPGAATGACVSVGETETEPVFPEWLIITHQEMAKTPNLCWVPKFPSPFSHPVISRRSRTCGPGKSEKTD